VEFCGSCRLQTFVASEFGMRANHLEVQRVKISRMLRSVAAVCLLLLACAFSAAAAPDPRDKPHKQRIHYFDLLMSRPYGIPSPGVLDGSLDGSTVTCAAQSVN